jgi:hypothetical protein
MFEMRIGGRRVDIKDFGKELERQVMEKARAAIEEKIHGAASSIVDPETGKHAEVFVAWTDGTNMILRTRGSPAFARELERRLDMATGTVRTEEPTMAAEDSPTVGVTPRLYIAHASEDHETLAKPLAEQLMASGIEVWFDEWEIRAGDSLRRKMEEGLESSTHFLVLLTPNSLHKPWVQTEIDAGFVRSVGGESRFIGVRVGVPVNQLSPFLRTLRCPEINLQSASEVEGLIADIHGVSKKPPLGSPPKYAQTVPDGLKGWSPGVVAVAEVIVHKSEHGQEMDPQLDVPTAAGLTGLSEEAVRFALMDLEGAGLIKKSGSMGSTHFWPRANFFLEFDRHFLGFDPKQDAVGVAAYIVNEKRDSASARQIAAQFPEWSPRRLNGALNYLAEAKLVYATKGYDGSPYAVVSLHIDDRTRRFVHENA